MMKKSKFGVRVVALVLVMIMVASLLPLSTLAATKFDMVTDRSITYTGIQNDTLNQNGTINWPIKIYDYLADGMLFEYAQADGATMYSNNDENTDDYSGQYVLGKPMPPAAPGHDYTTDYTYSSQKVITADYDGHKARYNKTKMPAVDYVSPQYMRITTKSGYYTSTNKDTINCRVANFYDDNGGNIAKANVRYMALVYRAGGLNSANTWPALALTILESGGTKWRFPTNGINNSIFDTDGNTISDSSEWKVFVCDLKSLRSDIWNDSISKIKSISFRIPQDKSSDYFDISHLRFFSTEAAAKEFGEQCLEFINEPGEYRSGTYWNGAGNDGFGMLYPSNGAAWDAGGGDPITSTNGGKYAGYYTQAIGGPPEKYKSKWTTGSNIAPNRKDGVDADGRYDGTGNLIGDSHMIYLMRPKSFSSTGEYDMSELKFDGYSLLTKASKGVFTAGLLEGKLGVDGTPQYREETVRYIADMLSKTLVIPRIGGNGRHNYNFIAGVKNREQYGYSQLSDGTQEANDLAQGLRNCLDIYFTGNTTAAAPKMGTYAETLQKADKLKGAFLAVAPNIDTCMDAAYYLLNNLFVANSYNQEQDDYHYLTLSSAKLTNGQDAYVFDGGFSNGASLDDVASGKITQTEYKELSDSAIEYSSRKNGGEGTISISKVDEKDFFYYTSSSSTTMYPFLPVTGATGVYAGGTDSYYFAEDGKRSYTDEFGTYKNRNYNYVLASNGEFVYHEEDKLFFEFEGDDDVYLFLNGQLVLDLGGGHSISSCKFDVNDYVKWAREVLNNPADYSEAEIERAEALDLKNGEIANFDFYYMERHGYGANMRIVTNMHITDPALRVEKTAYQGGKQIEYGGIVDANKRIEYNFKLLNVGNTKLYNLTFDDADIGVSLTPEKGLFVVGDDTESELDNINGYYVTNAHGDRLEAKDLTAIVSGYKNVGSGGNYIQSGRTYTKVTDGAGTHIKTEIVVNFTDNEDLKRFLSTLESEHTDGSIVADELTQEGLGLWVDSEVTFKGIYYTMTKDQEDAGMFDNTVLVSATTRVDQNDSSNKTLSSEARHRVYVTAIPSYYQWADHDLYISKKRVLDDASAEAGNESSMLHDYISFFNTVNGDITKFTTKLCDRVGNPVSDDYYKHVTLGYKAGDGTFGYKTDYPEPGINEFYILMYLNGKSGTIETMNLGEYAIVRVLIIVADVEDSEYVLDYGLSTENLDAKGELFKNDELYGSLSGTEALLMGVTNVEPTYMNVTSGGTDFNRINFDPLDLSENHKIQTEDGYYNVNILIPEDGKKINYDEFSGMYTLTETGTVTMHVDCPVAWQNLYLYYWYDDGRSNVWPGQKMSQISHGNFELAIPGNAPHVIISNGTNQTVNLDLNPGQEAWIDIPGTLNTENKLFATVEYKTADGIVHAKVPEGWGDVYYYCWDAFDNGLVQWPGTKVDTIDENGYYTFTIPGDITNIIINNGDNGKQTNDQVVYAGSETWLTVNSTIINKDEASGVDYYGATSSRSTETVTMHAKVPADWTGASLYYWNSNGSATGVQWPGLAMTKGDDGLYHLEGVPADVTNVVLNNGDTANNKQTHNLTITPGVETWFDVIIKSGEGETKVEANVPVNWSKACVYFFNDSGQAVGTAWPGVAAVKVKDGVFTIDAPAGATKYIVNNGSGEQTQDLKLIIGTTNVVEFYGNKNARPLTPTELHIEAPAGWNDVYVHYWYTDNNGVTHGTTWNGNAAKKNNDGTFSFEIPAGYNKFVINNGTEQTDDITEFYMGVENHIKINDFKLENGHNTYTVGMAYLTDIVYGELAEKEGFTFIPTDFMDSFYSIWMAVTVHENKVDEEDEGNVNEHKATALGNPINIAKEVQMFKKITVLPASVVYYEDDFAGIKYSDDSTNVFTHFGEGSGSLSQSADQNQAYGQDSAYHGSENDEITGGSLTKVEIKDSKEFASFSFKGTGFEIIGHTHAQESATLRVVVKDANRTVVEEKVVITEFDQGANGGSDSVEHVPLIRVSGLDFGTYTVSLNGVPVYDWSQWDGDRTHKPPVKKACICLDGVRIYQPLDNSDCVGENLALGKKTDAAPYTGSSFTADLTDGKAGTTLKNYSDWFAFKNTGDAATGNINPNNNNRAVFTVNLGCEAEITNIRLHHFKGTNDVGAGTFGYINVYYSSDGNTFKYIDTINPDSTKTAPYWAGLDISSAPVTAKYIKFALGADAGSLVLINEIEIYGKEVTVPGRNDAYIDTENGASFTEIRNLIAERQAFAVKYDDMDGLSVSGGTNTWIENRNNVLPSNRDKSWKNNAVNSVTDYLLAGPNNEVYMIESTDEEKSALVFYVTEEALAPVNNMQVAIRALDYGTYIGSKETGLIHAEIQYGAMVDGKLVWKPLTTILTTAEQYYTIPYKECPYDAENNRYQVVLRVGDSDIKGMASYTSIKLNGLELNTLNTSEVPDIPEIIYADELKNTILDNNGNTLDSSKFVDFLQLSDQMQSDVVMYSNLNGEAAPEGVDTSDLGVLYDSFTADNSSNFALTQDSKIYIVTSSEDAKPSYETIETAQLVQTQFMADARPSSAAMNVVWGLEKYAEAGDILIYADESGYGAEEFKVVVTDRAKVYASDDNGLLFGLNTLQKHFRKANSNVIKGFTLQDKPDTKERAVHLDCARKYLTPEYIKNFIAEMSWMGYNAIELHMSEDGGFRMDFWGDTALSQVPGMSGNDFSWVCGSNPAPWVYEQFQDTADKGKYLTTEEVISICQVAKKYNMEVIPSFDTPAHVGYMTELYYNTVYSDYNSPIRYFTYNGTQYTLPEQINYREYTGSDDSRYDFSVLNLADHNVKNFAYAMYNDIAAFFKYYAGSTDFNIGADEVALKSTDVWTYTDFVNYVNQVNSILKSKGYTTRMYNDFVYNTKYTSETTGIDSDIEIVYWDAPSITTSSTTENIRRASFFHTTQNRVVYSGVQNWTYYVLRIAPTSTATHMDARDPDNRQWTFYRNQEDLSYNEWDPTRLSEYTITYSSQKHGHYSDYYSGENLGGGYFMVWNDFAGLNTEVETWNGCVDTYGKYSSGSYSGYGYNYSLIERMWSNAAKQWNWDLNSSVDFADFETLRDSMGFFPGYVATPDTQAYAKGFVLAQPTAVSDLAYRTNYTVTFVDYDGKVLNTQAVREGSAAIAPTDPTKPADVWYTYTFSGWDTDFSNITEDTVVKATYSSSATTAGKIGYLEVKVSGGTNFNMSMGIGDQKPMGTSYVNPRMELGVAVTVTAETTNGNKFIGWMDVKNGHMLTTSATYSFFTTGNDVLAALYDTELDDRGVVTFRNNKTNQIIDIQYYSSTDTIVFPADISYPGYEFMGWNYTEAQIQAKLSEGKDVTVLPIWRNEDVYYTITVNDGKVTDSPAPVDGKYIGYKGTTVTANNAPSGKIFAYWADEEGNVLSYSPEYKFYPYKDTVLTATYINTTALGADIIGTMTDTESARNASDTFKVYFENNWKWSDVSIYYWGVDDAPVWHGVPMTYLENNGTYDIYVYDVPSGVTGFIINGIKDDGSGDRDQTPNITQFVDGRQYSMTWSDGNNVMINDSRVESSGSTDAQDRTIYLYVSEEWESDDAWFALYGWDTNNGDDNTWVKFTKVSGNIYAAQLPVKYYGVKFLRMNPDSDQFSWDNVWNQTNDITVTPTDEYNMYVVTPGWDTENTFSKMNTVYFVNDRNWENITVSYTDDRGTYVTEAVFYEKDENGNDIYKILIPAFAKNVIFSDGTQDYVYKVRGELENKAIFAIRMVDNHVEADIVTNVDMDTTTLADSNMVIFSWEVPEDTEYTFVNAGLLLVREEDYSESSFKAGTIDSNVIQFVPARMYQHCVGIHSITIPQVLTGDGWVACSFVQYRDEQGILRTKYSNKITGKK